MAAVRCSVLLTIALPFVLALPARGLCPTDCNGDGSVTVNEVVRSVGLGLGEIEYRLCPPADTSGDLSVTVDEIVLGVSTALAGCPATIDVFMAPALTEPTGPRADGRGILPSGRRVEPAGTQIPASSVPLNLALTPDERFLVVTNDGWGDPQNRQFLQLVDTGTLEFSRTEVPHFFGLAFNDTGDQVYVGHDPSGQPNPIEALSLGAGVLERLPEPVAELPVNTMPSGMALSPDGRYLYVLGLRNNGFYSIDLETGDVYPANAPVGNYPYALVVAPDGQLAYVSSWGIQNDNPTDLVPAPLPPTSLTAPERSSVAIIGLSDPTAPQVSTYIRIAPSLRVDNKTIFGGSHPSAMQLSPDGKFLYVTATNLDLLVVIDTDTRQTIAEVALNVFDSGPVRTRLQGVYPNALAVSADGSRVYVADAGLNAVQVIAVNAAERTFESIGFIPTGWYPTALALTADGKRLYVANGKGAAIGPNGGEEFDSLGLPSDYIGHLLEGSVSVIDDVDAFDLLAGAATVTALNGFAPTTVEWVDGEPGPGQVQRGNPVPIDFGSGPSDLVQHVVFIMKENRTYDQLLGDLEGGNGDPSLAYFGGEVTPNHQALARQFATGDNFYEEGEVSTSGHEWIDQANANDWTQKLVASNYDRNFPSDRLEQGLEGFTKGGFVWQFLERQGVSFRVYGETLSLLSRFATGIDGGGVVSIALPLVDAFGRFPSGSEIATIINGDIETLRDDGVDVDTIREDIFPNMNLDIAANILPERTDRERAEIFVRELQEFEEKGELPSYLQIWLPNDHTFGARAGTPTVRSAVADNDEGLGLIVEALTQSSFWPHMAIFVTEDDAQDGQDHVSAYRTISLVISPYAKRGYVSKIHHSNMSMTKTISLLLGVAPMSQYDRYATDMRDYFTTEPDLTPYAALPRQVPIEVNGAAAQAPNEYLRQAALLSEDLNLESYDEAGPDMSRIIELVHLGRVLEEQRPWTMLMMLLASAGMVLGVAVVATRELAAKT